MGQLKGVQRESSKALSWNAMKQNGTTKIHLEIITHDAREKHFVRDQKCFYVSSVVVLR